MCLECLCRNAAYNSLGRGLVIEGRLNGLRQRRLLTLASELGGQGSAKPKYLLIALFGLHATCGARG